MGRPRVSVGDPQPSLATTVVIRTWAYSARHSGIRALFTLCHHLNRLGFRAFVTIGADAPAGINAPVVTARVAKRLLASHNAICVYPEVISGNPLEARNVVRYLLNRPGFFTGVGMEAFSPGDYFLHHAEEFLPPGLRRSRRLTMPTVDQTIFYRGAESSERRGFVLYSDRFTEIPSDLPDWMHPTTMASMSAFRSPSEMAALYRSHVALVTWERTAAIGEAIQCGCPVIVVPSASFDAAPIVERYQGNGIAIGLDQARLLRATELVDVAAQSYLRRFDGLDEEIRAFVADAVDYFAARPPAEGLLRRIVRRFRRRMAALS